jgi:hypothetical protein
MTALERVQATGKALQKLLETAMQKHGPDWHKADDSSDRFIPPFEMGERTITITERDERVSAHSHESYFRVKVEKGGGTVEIWCENESGDLRVTTNGAQLLHTVGLRAVDSQLADVLCKKIDEFTDAIEEWMSAQSVAKPAPAKGEPDIDVLANI